MASKEQAERALRHHEETLFGDPAVHYASVRRGGTAPGEDDWLIEVGVSDPAKSGLGRELAVPGPDGQPTGDGIAIRLVPCGEITTQAG